MTWRNKTTEEIEELRRFVEDMKRGTTPATGDSLLETLRQIHDHREALAPEADHRRMLLARLRREMAERDGQPVSDRPVLTFPRESRVPMVLKWALAASLVVHVSGGFFVLNWVHDNSVSIADALGQPGVAPAIPVEDVTWLPLPNPVVLAKNGPVSKGARSTQNTGGARGTDSREIATASGYSRAAATGSARTVPGPVTAPALPTMLGDFSASESMAEMDLDDPANNPLPLGPAAVETYSEVASESYEAGFDVAPEILRTQRPHYPARALADQVQGNVKVRALFDADGKVRDIRIVKGLGYGLDDAAIQAVRQIKFKPATRNGVAVSATTTIVVRFGIR